MLKSTGAVLITLGLINYLVLPQIAEGRKSADVLRHLNPFLLIVAVAFEGASLVAYSVLTRVTLPPKPRLPLFTILRVQLATKAVGNVTPGGSVAGGTLGYRLLVDEGVAPTAAGFSLATVGLGSAVVLNLILWLALLISIPFNGYKPIYLGAAVVGVVLLLAAGALVFLLMEGRDRAEAVLRGIARHIPRVKEDTASRFVHQLADRLYELARSPELIRNGVLWAAANWFLDIAALWVFLRAFGQAVSPINLIVAYGVAGVLAAIPLTPGGLGVVEAALPTLLAGFNVPYHTALLGVLAWRFAQFWLPIPLGGLSYASLKIGPITDEGRRRRLEALRELAVTTGSAATKRVWDEETGKYRVVAAGVDPDHLPEDDLAMVDATFVDGVAHPDLPEDERSEQPPDDLAG